MYHCFRLHRGQDLYEAVEAYVNDHHITATVRQEMGADINAACGQLRNKHL